MWFLIAALVLPPNTETTEGEPMAAAEAAETMVLPEGFTATVFAAEPEVMNPIGATWDSKGRLWVAENYTYERLRGANLPEDLRDRILIFDDTDGDGVHDTREIFADDLKNLTSVEWSPDGVYVMCPPRLLFIADADQDDKPDGPPVTVLDGFTEPEANNHNFANGLKWGPDGWLYGRCGASAPGEIGLPGTPAAERVPLRGTMWRYHPGFKVYETLSHGAVNPWGHDWNADGELFFVNTVNGHFFHQIPGAHYTRAHTLDPNPYVYELIDFHADHWHFDTSGSWQDSRDGKANDLGGGHAHIGLNIYQGNSFPEYFQGKALTINMHGRRCNVEKLSRKGSGYVASHEPDFFISKDPFFRGLELLTGPDGSLFVLDWSDTGECHETTGVHRTSGRIFKISYEGGEAENVKDLSGMGGNELMKLRDHPNVWQRRMAGFLLGKQNSEKTTKYAFGAGRLDTVTGERPVESSSHGSDREPAYGSSTEVTPADIFGAGEARLLLKDAGYRLNLASQLQRLPHFRRIPIAGLLLSNAEDANDHNIPLMIWYGLIPLGESDPEALAALGAGSKIPNVTRFIARRLAEDVLEKPENLGRLLELVVGKPKETRLAVLQGIVEATAAIPRANVPAAWPSFSMSMWEVEDPEARKWLRDVEVLFGNGREIGEIRAIVLDGKAELEDRKAALETLIRIGDPELKKVCLAVLETKFLNLVAARGLTRFDDPEAAKSVVVAYGKFHPFDHPQLLATLATRPVFARALLKRIEEGKIPKKDLTPAHARQIAALGDAELTALLGKVWGRVGETPEANQKMIAELKKSLTPEFLGGADLAAGKGIFATHCATCHKMNGEGGEIGPDLTGSGRSNLDFLLQNIVAPSAEVSADYLLTVFTMKDGRVLSGTVLRESPTTLTLQTPAEKMELPVGSVEKREASGVSLMPEGLLQTLTADQQRDLLAWLMGA